jgi:hypothetical protein
MLVDGDVDVVELTRTVVDTVVVAVVDIVLFEEPDTVDVAESDSKGDTDVEPETEFVPDSEPLVERERVLVTDTDGEDDCETSLDNEIMVVLVKFAERVAL